MKTYGNSFWRLHVIKNKKFSDNDIENILNNPSQVTKIIQSGIKDALLKHKQAGNKVCGWHDNKVVWIQPEKITAN